MSRFRDPADEYDYDSSYADYINEPGYRRQAGGTEFDADAFSDPDDDDGLDPPWTDVVGDQGDVFYVEPSLNEPIHVPQPHSNPESILKSKANHQSVHQSVQNNGVLSTTEQNGHGRKKRPKKIKSLIGARRNNDRINNDMPPQNHVNFSHTVTFHDVPTGVLREVELFVEPGKRNYGRRATLCESLFGIVPGRFKSKPFQPASKTSNVNGGPLEDTRIMVQMLLPDGEAHRSGSIKIGDWLMCVNDLEVDFDNINSVLSMITSPRKVKLTLQKLAVECEPKPVVSKKSNIINDSLVKIMNRDSSSADNIPAILQRLHHVVLYLTLDVNSETMSNKEDVMYQFPKRDTKLVELRGMFSTLSHLMKDVSRNTAESSTLLIEGQLVHVVYMAVQREVFVIAMAADRVSLYQIKHVMKDMIRLLEVLFGSLKGAFNRTEHHGKLDHFFTLTFQRLLLHEDMEQMGIHPGFLVQPFLNSLPAVRTLLLPDEIKVNVDNCMSEFESADFADMSDDYYGLRRSYTILGTCLFYKGYLLASHLSRDDLRDIALYAQYYCLLVLSDAEQMGQLVIWREVFPTEKRHALSQPQEIGYTPPHARWFLMIVGRRNCLYGVLLEAGGCATLPSGHPAPDPFYVDQAKATLLQLESMGILAQCDTVLDAPDIPALISADWFFQGAKPAKSENAGEPTVSAVGVKGGTPKKQTESILKKSSPQLGTSGRVGWGGAIYEVESDADSHSTGNSESSTPVLDRRTRQGSDNDSLASSNSANMFKTSRRKRLLPNVYDMSGMRRSLDDVKGRYNSIVKLTAGLENSLFHYVSMDAVDGVYISPTEQEFASLHGPDNDRLIQNFYQACLIIRQVFEKSRHELSTDAVSSVREDCPSSSVKEHGILFQCTADSATDSGSHGNKKAPPVMCYWVVGRLYTDPFPREVFVCFHDGAAQNMIELAFKLSFGMSL